MRPGRRRSAADRALAVVTALVCSVAALTACSGSGADEPVGAPGRTTSPAVGATSSPTPSGPSRTGAKIGLLLPDDDNARYDTADHPLFVRRVAEKCPDCTVLYQNARADAGRQLEQAETMVAQGVEVLVISAQDARIGKRIVGLAHRRGVAVVAYDRLIDSGDIAGYISFDNELVGSLQAQALIDRMAALDLPDTAGYLAVNGSPADPNAAQFKAGADFVLGDTKYRQLASYDTPDWKPAKAEAWARRTVERVGTAKVKGVYAANDSTGAAVAAALRDAGLTRLPPITGQDASLAGIQDVLDGTLYLTIYKAFQPEAYGAADAAVALTQGRRPHFDLTTKTPGGAEVPATLLDPVAVTAETVQDTVVAGGLYTAAQICTKPYAAACRKYGVH